MAFLKQFSVAHIVSAFIFGFLLVSSSVTTAARVMVGIRMNANNRDGTCHYIGQCTNDKDCVPQCKKVITDIIIGSMSVPDPDPRQYPSSPHVCCCIMHTE
ncbi:hypothetical protein MKW98_021182 [Papaver atlanticum]|uniref:Uncharacterized protein n=1 Tax=Papaver atlanticum TaxID=357466 RepID=A0AAD4T9V9_9MAGN|nr:hypothetical protein MKW98_021182 [Papaver atlanticum]